MIEGPNEEGRNEDIHLIAATEEQIIGDEQTGDTLAPPSDTTTDNDESAQQEPNI